MTVSDKEALQILKAPKNGPAIELAKNQEERLLLHCETILEKYSLPFWAYRNFTLWWQSLITKEKHNKIDQLITTPLATTSVTDDIFMQIRKFQDAQDRYVSFEFTNPDFTNDFSSYLQKVNNDTFWRDNCMDALKTGICDVVVIDLPSVQTTKRPEPYKYFVSPSMMIDIVKNKFTGNLEYFAFRQSEFKWDSALQQGPVKMPGLQQGDDIEKCIFIDDLSYRILWRKRKSEDWTQVEKVDHNLGFCPCIDFWEPSIKGSNGINKKGILTPLYSKLDMYLFYSALVAYMDVYGAFPIFVTYAMEDEQWDDKRKDVNFGDYYSPSTSSYLTTDKGTSQNPRVSYRWMGAPGSIIEYPQPADGQDANFVKDSPHFINMPTDALKHVNDRCASLKADIIKCATGEDTEYMNEIIKNADMLNASYNKQDSILTFVKRQVERVHRFDIKTTAILRYGKEYFLRCTVDYGSDYFLKDASKIVQEYDAAVKAGMSPEYCMQIAKEASQTRFKNNLDILARQRIIADIIPYGDKSNDELIELGIDQGDLDNYVIRINSGNFVRQFELEFGDIVYFGSTLNYGDKIKLIKKQLERYGNELDWKVSVPDKTGGISADS